MNRLIMAPLAALAGAVTVLAIAVAPASAAPSTTFAAGFAGNIQITSADPAGNPMSAAYGGSGVGTHRINRMQGTINVQGPAPSCGEAGGFTAQHMDTLTASDGSQLVVQVNEVACGIGSATYRCEGTYKVLSGTGRFARATGSGAFDGVVSFNPDGSGQFLATYFGQLSGVR
jgi:hypothetical protein